MQKKHFSIVINAPVEKVWRTMIEDATYRDWTSVFNPGGSYYEGSWEKGEKIVFVGPDKDTGELGGMVARIADNRPYEFISIEHVGILKNGVEDTESEEAKAWTPAYENYTFRQVDGGTEVTVDIDIDEKYEKMFEEMWPKALARLKEISEK